MNLYPGQFQRGSIPEDLVSSTTALIDTEIGTAIENGYLLYPNTADKSAIRHASYQLRIGTDVQYLILGINPDDTPYERKPGLQNGDNFEIEPGQTVKVNCMERINIPDNILALALPVGNLYLLGLTPEVTFADPGYHGLFHITVCNYSRRIVTLTVGQPLARMIFFHLSQKPANVHGGENQRTHPVLYPRPLPRRSLEELNVQQLRDLLNEIQAYDPPHYEHAFVTTKLNAVIGALNQTIDHRLAITQLTCYALGVLVLMLCWQAWNHLLPEKLQDALTTSVVNSILVLLGMALIFFTTDIRKILASFFGHHGKLDRGQK